MNITDVQNKKALGLIGLCAKAGKIVSGADATIQDIEKHKVKLVIIAKDASEKTKKNMNYICQRNKVRMIEIGLIEELSNTIGKNNKAIIGIKSKDIADGLKKILDVNLGGDLPNG